MDAIIINEGFQVGNLYVPPFTLSKGEYLSLNFPSDYDQKEEARITQILTGRTKSLAVKIFEEMTYVSSDFRYPFFKQLFKPATVFTLLKKATNLSDDAIASALHNLNIKSNEFLSSLGFNERKLLALEMAYSKSKNIITNCSGLDYTGISAVRKRVLQDLEKGSLIELNYLSSKGREYFLDANIKRKVIEIVLS